MESRLKVNFDHETKEPYISIFMANPTSDDDLRDEMLQKFIEGCNSLPLCLTNSDGNSRGANFDLRIINTSSFVGSQAQLVGLFQNYTQNALGLATDIQKKLYNDFFHMIKEITGSAGIGTYYEVIDAENPKQS